MFSDMERSDANSSLETAGLAAVAAALLSAGSDLKMSDRVRISDQLPCSNRIWSSKPRSEKPAKEKKKKDEQISFLSSFPIS